MVRGLDGCFLVSLPHTWHVQFSSSTERLAKFRWCIAKGRHLFPFRTEQLSLSAPMVLGGQPPGRVGRRRFFIEQTNSEPSLWGRLFVVLAARRYERRLSAPSSGSRSAATPRRSPAHSYLSLAPLAAGWGSGKLPPEAERDAAVSATALAGCGRGRDGRGCGERRKGRAPRRRRVSSHLSTTVVANCELTGRRAAEARGP